MCGIFGGNDDSLNFSVFYALMSHRGPDARGQASQATWTLGHLRLAIVDLDNRSNQPFSKHGTLLSSNGEIYNYRELKAKFFPTEQFETDSDTELLISLLDLLGHAALNHLNGMFAFAWIDRAGDLLIARDRFGVKPLYYCNFGGKFYFSSEIKPLLVLQGSAEFDALSLQAYLAEKISDFNTASGYTGILTLNPGHFLRVRAGFELEPTRWYSGESSAKKSPSAEMRDEVEEVLVDAIRLRCQADAPVCVALSGGIDSSTIYVLLKERLGLDVQPVVYRKTSASNNEAELAIRLAAKYGDKPIVVGEELHLGKIGESLTSLEYPIWNISSLAYQTFYEAIAKHGYKVVVEGHGADELLGGYPYMAEAAVRELALTGRFSEAASTLRLACAMAIPDFELENRFKKLIRYGKNSLRITLSKEMPGFQASLDEAFGRRILPMVLRTFDRMSMSQSVESRMPFMDYRFVELAKRLPLEQKISKEGSKAVLREILRKYDADEIADVQLKTGFGSNLSELMKSDELLEYLHDLAGHAPEVVKSWSSDRLKKSKNRRKEWLYFDAILVPAMFGHLSLALGKQVQR